jgi:DNA-binding GntR family transcriptional regulator
MLEALNAQKLDVALEENQAFHFDIYEAASYPQLLDIISNLWLRTGPILALVRRDKNIFLRIFSGGHGIHKKIIEAIGRRDRVSARRAMALDIRAAHYSIRRYYKLANELHSS